MSGSRSQIGAESTFNHGQKAVGTSAAQITSTQTVAKRGVQLKSLAGNTAKVYVGSSDQVTSATGFELSAGDGLFVPVTNLENIWLIAASGTQTVCWLTVGG